MEARAVQQHPIRATIWIVGDDERFTGIWSSCWYYHIERLRRHGTIIGAERHGIKDWRFITLKWMEQKGMFGPSSNVWTLQTILRYQWTIIGRQLTGSAGRFGLTQWNFLHLLRSDNGWAWRGTFTSRKRGANLNVDKECVLSLRTRNVCFSFSLTWSWNKLSLAQTEVDKFECIRPAWQV